MIDHNPVGWFCLEIYAVPNFALKSQFDERAFSKGSVFIIYTGAHGSDKGRLIPSIFKKFQVSAAEKPWSLLDVAS